VLAVEDVDDLQEHGVRGLGLPLHPLMKVRRSWITRFRFAPASAMALSTCA